MLFKILYWMIFIFYKCFKKISAPVTGNVLRRWDGALFMKF